MMHTGGHVDGSPDHKRALYRYPGIWIPALVFFLFEAVLGVGIRGNGCGLPITFSELLPVIATLGAGVVGSAILLWRGSGPGRRGALAAGTALGCGVLAGVVGVFVSLSVFNCM
jgi:hypothetical protein